MTFRLKKTWLAALGVALVVSTGGVAVARDAGDWYDGDNATVADTNRVSETL